MGQQPAKEPVPQGYQRRINWRVADDHPASFANQFMVQIARDEFVLTLGQLVAPALVHPTREEIEALPERISPQIVARVAVTPAGLRQFSQLIQQQLSLYESGVRGLSEIQPDIPDDGEEA